MAGRLKTVRQRLRVQLDELGAIEVTTRPFDYNLWAQTSRRHDWPSAEQDPITFLTFLAWSAARRAGQIPPDLKWEKFLADVADVTELEVQEVDPTQPAP